MDDSFIKYRRHLQRVDFNCFSAAFGILYAIHKVNTGFVVLQLFTGRSEIVEARTEKWILR